MKIKSFKVPKVIAMLMASTLIATAFAGCSGGAQPQSSSPESKAPASQSAEAPAADSQSGSTEEQSSGGLTGDIEVGVLPAEGTTTYNHLVSVADELMAENPGTSITYTFANSKARPFMEQRWRSGDAPDIDYFVFNAQVPKTHEFIDKLLDLTPYLEEDSWGESFTESVDTVTKFNGGTYGVITDTHIIALFYNKKMFEEFGITPPENWDQLMEACAKLKENGKDPIAVTGMYQPYMGFWLDYLMQREVGYDEAKDAVINGGLKDNPGLLRAAQKIEHMVKEGYFLNGFEGTDFTAAQIQFFQGNTGMILMGTWLSSEMKDSIPEDFELGVVAFPTVSGGAGQQNGVVVHSNIMSVNKDTDNLDLVLAFMKRVTGAKVQTERSQELSLISAVKGVPAPVGTYGLDEVVGSVGDMYVRYFGLEYEPDKFNAYYNEVAKLFFGEYTAEQFINAADGLIR